MTKPHNPGLRLLALLAAVAGCTGEANAFERFVGLWEYQKESVLVATCSSRPGQPQMVPLQGLLLEIDEGTDAALVVRGTLCPALRLDVTDSTATARAHQSCATAEDDTDPDPSTNLGTITTTHAVTSFNLTIDGLDATESSSLMRNVRATKTPQMLDCTISTMGTLRKVAK